MSNVVHFVGTDILGVSCLESALIMPLRGAAVLLEAGPAL